MFAHALEQDFTRHVIGAVPENPARRLVMPDERMAHDVHAMLLAKFDVLVGGSKVVAVGTWLGMDDFPLERVLRRDGIEMPGDQRDAIRVLSGKLPLIDRDADKEIFFVSVLERCGFGRGSEAAGQQE